MIDSAAGLISVLSLHDALPIFGQLGAQPGARGARGRRRRSRRSHPAVRPAGAGRRSEEHTSELQSHVNLVCRLLLEKKNKHYILPLTLLQLPPSASYRARYMDT